VSRPEPRVVAENVSKWFGALVAVSDVSFEIGPGVTALLGPNGAGKSTMLRMLCGLARPSKGTVRVLGQDPRTDVGITRSLGLVPQQESIFEPLTAHAFVQLAATLHGLPDPDAAAAAALETVGLDPGDKRRLPTYSKGMRQRVKVAQGLVHEPSVLMLDEPLTGLDPRQRADMIALSPRGAACSSRATSSTRSSGSGRRSSSCRRAGSPRPGTSTSCGR
jgi:ABC-2 type transport system ATP-binding protein